ncbi:MAG: rod shape-determining protein MreD [Peptococcaceae bacterium]|nr:rod shape-determining protein MreD [Peptococcaceae bacterium]
MRVVVLFLVAFLGIVLRDTVFNGLSVAGGKPDFVLIMVVYFAIFRGSVQGGLLGAALGLMEDLMTGRFIGINAICKGLIGFMAGYSERNLHKNNFFVPIAAVLIATFGNAVLYYLFSVMIGGNVGLDTMLFTSIPDAVYNMCFSPVFYAVFYRFFAAEAGN